MRILRKILAPEIIIISLYIIFETSMLTRVSSGLRTLVRLLM